MEMAVLPSHESYVSCMAMGGHMDYSIIPLRALNVSCRRQLSIALLQEMPLLAKGGVTRDWQGLGELAGFRYELIMLWKNKRDPVLDMLEYWCNQPSNPSVFDLINNLELMERFDIIDDLAPCFERDGLAYLRSDEHKRKVNETLRPIQVPQISSVDMMEVSHAITVDDAMMDIESVELGRPQQKRFRYDAYISYVEADADFAATMVNRLENLFKLRLYVKDRDLLPGLVESDADLTMINERCEKILLIVSNTSLVDAHCEWRAIIAQASAVDTNLHSRKVIPIVCKNCILPPRFKYLSRLDYNKKDMFGSFWRRLYCSIKSPMPEIYMGNGSPYSLSQTVGGGDIDFSNQPTHLIGATTSAYECGATLPLQVLHLIPELSLTRTTDDPNSSYLFDMMLRDSSRSRSPTPEPFAEPSTSSAPTTATQTTSGTHLKPGKQKRQKDSKKKFKLFTRSTSE